MLCVILDSPGGLQLRRAEKSIKGMLKYRTLILQERKSVNTIRGIQCHRNGKTSKASTGKPKVTTDLPRETTKSWWLPGFLFQLTHFYPLSLLNALWDHFTFNKNKNTAFLRNFQLNEHFPPFLHFWNILMTFYFWGCPSRILLFGNQVNEWNVVLGLYISEPLETK